MKEMRLRHSSVQQGNSCDEPTCTTTQFVNASNVIGNQREDNHRPEYDNGSKYLFLHRTKCEPLDVTSDLGLGRPSLVVSIEGQTDVDLDPDIKKAVRRGLQSIARNSDHSIEPWVITDGKKGGINQVVGHAARDSYGNIVVIGVDQHPVPGERRASCENLPSVTEVTSRLDPNHSHFIVWSTNDNPRAINVRTQVEEGLLNIENLETKTTVPTKIVPAMCLLVVGDSFDTIERLCTRVKQGIPAVIMKGSGRAANLIADVYKDHGLETPQRRTKELIHRHLSPCKDSQTVERHLETSCGQYRDLITVYDAKDSSAQDFGEVLLQTSLNGTRFSQMFKLHRMIEWGRLDLFKSFVSSDQVSLEPEELKQLLWFAIAENKVEFVELFLERGAILNRYQVSSDETGFPKLADVIALYNNIPEDSLLGKLLVNAKRGQVDWSDIGSLITRLIGDFYVSPYGEATSDPDPRLTGHRTNPVTDLFTWALLMNHFELSLIFWRMQKESFIASSVFAFALLGGQKQILGCPGKRKLKENANSYQRLAIQMVEECWNSDRDQTIQLLTTENPLWGDVECWYLALRSKNKYFLAQKACMQIRKDLWKPVQWHIRAKVKNWMFDRQRILEGSDTSTFCHKLLKCVLSPSFKFYLNVLAFLCFLVFYSYYLLVELDGYTSYWDCLVIAWWGTFLGEEIRQIAKSDAKSVQSRLGLYLSDYWNRLDAVSLISFPVGELTKLCPCANCLGAGRALLSLTVITFYMRMLQFFYVFKATGPMMVMIYEMMIKVGSWLAITMVFICSYAIASESVLHPNSEINWKLLYHFPRKAYWQLHGELLLDEIEGGQQDCTNQPALYNNYTQPRCPSPLGEYFVPVLLGIYMLATNVLLVNLLIAIFSNTVNRIDSNNMKHIMHRRFKLLLEFQKSPYLPPPLNVISFLYFIVCWSKRKLIHQDIDEKGAPGPQFNDEQFKLNLWEWQHVPSALDNYKNTPPDDMSDRQILILERLESCVRRLTICETQILNFKEQDLLPETVG